MILKYVYICVTHKFKETAGIVIYTEGLSNLMKRIEKASDTERRKREKYVLKKENSLIIKQ